MNRQTIIVIITPTLQIIECWGNLKKACIAHGWAYNTLSKRKLPIEYEGYRIERVNASCFLNIGANTKINTGSNLKQQTLKL